MTALVMGVTAEWTPRLASAQADLRELLDNAEQLRAARRRAVALLRATNEPSLIGAYSHDANRAFVESLLTIEELVRDVQAMLNIW